MLKLSEKEIEEYLEGTTHGAEMEAPNWDTRIDISDLGEMCSTEWELINHKGIANDPERKLNLTGAEIKVHPTDTEEELRYRIMQIWERIGMPEITAGPTLHTHVRVPAMFLDENVHILQHLIEYTCHWGPQLVPLISPLPPMSDFGVLEGRVLEKMTYFFKAKYRHRHRLLTQKQVDRVKKATTFLGAICGLTASNKKGQPSWNIHNRETFNFARLRPTAGETLEFRMFSLTQDPEEVDNICQFALRYLRCALANRDPIAEFQGVRFPAVQDWKAQAVWLNPACAEIHDLTDAYDGSSDRSHSKDDLVNNYAMLLRDKRITLGDLSYPPFWETYFEPEEYQTLLDHSRSMEGKVDPRYGRVEVGVDVFDMFGGV